jgi:hypothetical protein
MKLHIENSNLRIELNTPEKIFTLHGSFTISVSHITEAKAAEPETSWRDLRAPGTFFPGIIKAGTTIPKEEKSSGITRRAKSRWCWSLETKATNGLFLGLMMPLPGSKRYKSR